MSAARCASSTPQCPWSRRSPASTVCCSREAETSPRRSTASRLIRRSSARKRDEARARDLPMFAICRGVQVLNVACGGTLVQDIPSQMTGALQHSLCIPPHESYSLAHEVWVDKDTLLARLIGERLRDQDACDVNSRHHQAVKDVARGFRVWATAP